MILGLAISFVAGGCGAFKADEDAIGDGYLTEGGWDPFSKASGEGWRGRKEARSGTERPAVDVPAVQAEGGVVSEKSPAADRLEKLFKSGDYRKAVAEANSLRSKSSPGSTDRDVAEFVAGASQYYLGNFQAAQPILDMHVKQFGSSRHRESALYYQASNRVRLREWRMAGALLDNYISGYPESLLLEFALFDRAACHFGQGEYQACLKLVERIERQYIYSKIRDRNLALKGDALQKSGDLVSAQLSYQKALEAADELKHPDLEARCLANLVKVAADRGQNSSAVKYYNTFFKSYGSSQYATLAARGGMSALRATGSMDSGLRTLERLLQSMPQSTKASVINETLGEYAKYYREKNGSEKLLRQLGDLSSSPKGSGRLKEALVIARLEALETYFPERVAEIRVYYKEVRERFKPSDLSAANALKLADAIAEENPSEAIVWYESALARGGGEHRANATLGLAKANAMSGNEREAETGFKSVLERFGSPDLAEEATLGIARIAQKNKDWSSSAHYWKSYLEHKDWDLSRGEARKGLDESKRQGGVARAPAPSHRLPEKPAPKDPVAQELAKAETLMASGKKSAAYESLDRLLDRLDSIEYVPNSSTVPRRKAQMLHEDLAIELGK